MTRALVVSALVAGSLAIAAGPTLAAAADVVVDGSDTTSDVGGCGSKANPCNTIEAGIDNAQPGDTVQVRKGTYAGAVVDKAVHLHAQGQVIVNDGPFSHPPLLRAGFLFNPDHSGDGATIEGFKIVGAVQPGGDDGKLDFGIFSRGADNVVVRDNSFSTLVQGVTAWDGDAWTIEKNAVTDLLTRNGGGIGILVGGRSGVPVGNHVVSKNDVTGTVFVGPGDGGGYDATGIVVFADFRFGQAGSPGVSNNVLTKNKVSLVSDTPTVVNANGIELTVGGSTADVITNNLVEKNDVRDMSGDGIVVSDGSSDNSVNQNRFRNSTGTDAVDESTGAGTAGTANTWTDNHCATSNPAGLCEHP